MKMRLYLHKDSSNLVMQRLSSQIRTTSSQRYITLYIIIHLILGQWCFVQFLKICLFRITYLQSQLSQSHCKKSTILQVMKLSWTMAYLSDTIVIQSKLVFIIVYNNTLQLFSSAFFHFIKKHVSYSKLKSGLAIIYLCHFRGISWSFVYRKIYFCILVYCYRRESTKWRTDAGRRRQNSWRSRWRHSALWT